MNDEEIRTAPHEWLLNRFSALVGLPGTKTDPEIEEIAKLRKEILHRMENENH